MNNKTVDIYNNLSSNEIEILNKLNISIKKGKYSVQEYEYLCMDIAQYYNEFDKLNLLNVSIDEYDIIIEKMYEFEQLFRSNSKEKSMNLYKKLNCREKYILKNLFIKIDNRTLKASEINQIINYIYNQKKKLSNVPISQNDFISAYKDYEKEKLRYFKDENSITRAMCYNEWPTNKYNVYNSLSDKSRNTIKKLGIEICNKEINSLEYSKILQELTNKLLLIFNTDITEKECDNLISKISKYLLNILN